MLNSMMKVDVLEIPYKGTGPALNDLSPASSTTWSTRR